MVFFSSGKDSLVTLDLVSKYIKDYEIVHFYYYKNLSIRENIFNWYEKRLGKKIIRLPHPERSWFFKRLGKKVKTNVVINDTESFIRNKYNMFYTAQGHRIAESLTRRAMLKKFSKGIDEKSRRVYPVLNFKEKHIYSYIKKNRLKLPVDYSYGFRDINIFKGDALIWLYNNFREDYISINKEFPFVEGDLHKALWRLKNY